MSPSRSPSARSDSAFAYDSLHLGFVLFGGFDGSHYLGETWRYDVGIAAWTNATPVQEPGPRADGRMAHDSRNHRCVIFGGNDYSGPNFTFHHLDDTWVYSWSDNKWTEISLSIHPSARDYAVFDVDDAKGGFLLHGGYGERVILGDLWTFDLNRSAWIEVRLAYGPPPRFAAVGGYASRENVFMIFGGLGNSGLLADTWLFRRITSTGSGGPALASETYLLIVTAGGLAVTAFATVLYARFRRRRRRLGYESAEMASAGPEAVSGVQPRR